MREAERGILGLMCRDDEMAKYGLSVLEIDDFDDPICKLVFRTMGKISERGMNVDIITLKNYCDGVNTRDIISIATEEGIDEHFDSYLKEIREERVNRELERILNRGLDYVSERDPDAIDKLKFEIDGLCDIQVKDVKMEMTEDEIRSAFLAVGEKKDKLETGFPDIDSMMGGYSRGSLNIIAGRPSMGKSTMSMNIATNVLFRKNDDGKMDKTVLYFSIEEYKSDLLQRIGIKNSGYPKNAIISNYNAMDRFTNAMEDIIKAKDRFYIDDSRNLKVDQIEYRARKFKAAHEKVDLIVIDYLGLLNMSGENKKLSRQQQIGETTRRLKVLAGELDTAIILLCQMNRAIDSEDRNPRLSDLRESGDIEQDADTVMFMHRDKAEAGNVSKAVIAKNRDGATGVVDLAWKPDIYTFVSLYDDTFKS